jgi:L-asparaginase
MNPLSLPPAAAVATWTSGSKSVLIVHTGGTIGQTQTVNGWDNRPGHLESLLRQYSIITPVPAADASMPPAPADYVRIVVKELPSGLFDSSLLRPEKWNEIAMIIYENRDRYCGFVVTHGTDTLSYSAAALGYMLPNFCKPIVFTASQVCKRIC